MDESQISALILAGGQAKRAGGILKTEIIVDGETIFSRMISVLKPIFDRIIISTNTDLSFDPYNSYPQFADRIRSKGPLGGIHSALYSSPTSSAVFVFAGDMPFPDNELIIMMLEHFRNDPHEALIPKVNDLYEPLHGIYSVSLLHGIEQYLETEQNPSVISFLHSVDTDFLVLEDSEKVRKAFTNINSPAGLFY